MYIYPYMFSGNEKQSASDILRGAEVTAWVVRVAFNASPRLVYSVEQPLKLMISIVKGF